MRCISKRAGKASSAVVGFFLFFFSWQPNSLLFCVNLCASWLWTVIRQGLRQLLAPQGSHHSAGSLQGQKSGFHHCMCALRAASSPHCKLHWFVIVVIRCMLSSSLLFGLKILNHSQMDCYFICADINNPQRKNPDLSVPPTLHLSPP